MSLTLLHFTSLYFRRPTAKPVFFSADRKINPEMSWQMFWRTAFVELDSINLLDGSVNDCLEWYGVGTNCPEICFLV